MEEHDINNNTKVSKAVVRISKSEERQLAHCEEKQVMKPRSNAAINHIEIDDPGNPEKTILITDRDGMKETVMTAFKKNSPRYTIHQFFHEPFLSIIAEDGFSGRRQGTPWNQCSPTMHTPKHP